MARVLIARQLLSDAGVSIVYSDAAADGHKVENTDGKVFLHICNYGSQDIAVTVRTSLVVAGLKLPDRVVTVETGTEKFIGPFRPEIYSQVEDSKRYVYVDYSSTDAVTVAALMIP